MVALHVIFNGQFPVGFDRIQLAVGDLCPCPAVHAGGTGQCVGGDSKIERLLGKGREYQAFHDLHRQVFQGGLGAPKRFRHLAGNQQVAVQIVGPGMIGTDEPGSLGLSRAPGAEARTAVPANIQQAAYLACRGSNDDDRLGTELDHQVIAGARDAADMARTKPMPKQHALHVALEDGRVGIEFPRQRMARRVITDACSEVDRFHGAIVFAVLRQHQAPC